MVMDTTPRATAMVTTLEVTPDMAKERLSLRLEEARATLVEDMEVMDMVTMVPMVCCQHPMVSDSSWAMVTTPHQVSQHCQDGC